MKRTIRKTIAAVMSLIVTIGAFSLNGLKAYADSDNVDISSKYATKLNVGDYDNYLRMNDSFFSDNYHNLQHLVLWRLW